MSVKVFDSVVRPDQVGPIFVNVRVRDGVAEIRSTGYNQTILVREREEVHVDMDIMLGTVPVQARICATRLK